MADQSRGTGSRPEGAGRRPESAKSHQPEGAGRYLPEGPGDVPKNAKSHQPEGAGRYLPEGAETHSSKMAETYFPEEAGGRILINLLAIRQRPITPISEVLDYVLRAFQTPPTHDPIYSERRDRRTSDRQTQRTTPKPWPKKKSRSAEACRCSWCRFWKEKRTGHHRRKP
jgi:hypothetical protein